MMRTRRYLPWHLKLTVFSVVWLVTSVAVLITVLGGAVIARGFIEYEMVAPGHILSGSMLLAFPYALYGYISAAK